MTLPNDPQTAIRALAESAEPNAIAFRRDIHAHPELGFEEVRTAGLVAGELTRLGIPHATGVGRTGVVGLIEGGEPSSNLCVG
jgi:metal-dependent amidase/aminoacylase/carboxypeptidase family protein